MVARLAQALVFAAVADALVAPTRPRPSRVARGAHGDGPLLSVPIPGSASATLQVPGFAAQRALLEALVEESRDVPPLAALRRSAALNAAVAKTARRCSRPAAARRRWRRASSSRSSARPSSSSASSSRRARRSSRGLDGRVREDARRAPPAPTPTVKRVVEASLGTTIAAAFSTFDEAPLATASVAQVHAATLRNGDRVVVKVLKPGVRDTLTADLVFLNGAAKILEAVAPETKRVSLADVAAQLRDSTLQELDLREEARRLRSFRGFLASSGLDQAATCPLPYEDLSSKEVLTMTRLDGSRLVDADASNPASEAAVATVIRTWARSVVEHDFFHADVHGGNVLLLRNGTVGIIDFASRHAALAVYGAVVDLAAAFNARPRDYGGIADALRGMGVADGAKFDREKFAGDLRRAFDAVEANDAAAIVGDVIAVSEDNDLVLPREFGLLTKQAVYLNRYATTPRRTSTSSRATSRRGERRRRRRQRRLWRRRRRSKTRAQWLDAGRLFGASSRPSLPQRSRLAEALGQVRARVAPPPCASVSAPSRGPPWPTSARASPTSAARARPRTKTKYKAVVDALAASSDVGGLQATLTHLLSDAVPQVVSRNVVAHFARAVAAVAPPERLESICSWAVAAIQPQKQSFEDADHALRHALYDCYLAEGSYKEAACTLGGIDVETCSKPYADLDKAALYVKIAETFLEDDESVDAETYVNRASGLMHAVDGKVHWALQLRYRVTLARTLDARRKFLDASMRYYELSQARHEEVNQDDLLALLSKAVTCALLGNAGPQRSRILGCSTRTSAWRRRWSSRTRQGDALLKRMFTGQVVRTPEIAAFTATLLPHQKALLGTASRSRRRR
ncbi:hypothetical protein JL720_8062 [Aureococcus anophagefferens]|nr:hypothetical protein JL720_8062 [Aureococcus anophagefferens]